MIGRPEANEAAPDYFRYIDQVPGNDILAVLETQLEEMMAVLPGISEEKSMHRYAPEKWSIRQVLNHVNDNERAFVFRTLWFARGFDTPLPGFNQDIASAGAGADGVSWGVQVEEFRLIRLSTLAFFHQLPAEAWMRRGTASGNPFTVRALGYIIAGHVTHHATIIRERYL